MPIDYERNDRERRVVLTASGTVTHDEAIAAIDRQIADGAWTYGIQYDIRNAETLPKPSQIFDILDYVRQQMTGYGQRGPMAIVADPGRNEQRLRTYTSLTDPSRRLATFTDVDEALRWLAEQTSAGTS